MVRVSTTVLLVIGIGVVGATVGVGWLGTEGFEGLAWQIRQAGRQLARSGGGSGRSKKRGKKGQGKKKEGRKRGAARKKKRAEKELKQVLRRLKPVLKAGVRELQQAKLEAAAGQGREAEEFEAVLGQLRQGIEIVVVKPDYNGCRCVRCGGEETKCLKWYYNHPWEASLERPTLLEVYREVRRCLNCGERFAPALDFVEPGGRYTKRVKEIVVASVVEDQMALERVPGRMKRDFHLPQLSTTTAFNWVQEAAGRVPTAGEYDRWVVERFSGVIGLDEVVEQKADGTKQYLVVAVDVLNQRTILFDLLDSRDETSLVKFLERLEEMGIKPEVVITDMWKAYQGALSEVFPEARQQLCVFHVIQSVMKHVRKAMLSYRRSLPQKSEAGQAARKELWEYRYVLLTSHHKLSRRQQERVEEILRQHAGTLLAEAYYLKEAILSLFRISQTPAAARQRRDQIMARFGHVPELQSVIKLLRGKAFEQMIVYLDYENLDKTNNEVERTNRTYRKGEKQRYRARTDQTRLNYVKLQARQRNQQHADRNERLKPKSTSANQSEVDQQQAVHQSNRAVNTGLLPRPPIAYSDHQQRLFLTTICRPALSVPHIVLKPNQNYLLATILVSSLFKLSNC